MATLTLRFRLDESSLIRAGFAPASCVEVDVPLPDDAPRRDFLARVWEEGYFCLPGDRPHHWAALRPHNGVGGPTHAPLAPSTWPPTSEDAWAALDALRESFAAAAAARRAAEAERAEATAKREAKDREWRERWQAWLATEPFAPERVRDPDPARVPHHPSGRPTPRELHDAGMIDLPEVIRDEYMPESFLTEGQRRQFRAAGTRLHDAATLRRCAPLLAVLDARHHARYLAGAMPDAELRPYLVAAHRALLNELVGDFVTQSGLRWEADDNVRSDSTTTSALLWELDSLLGEESANTAYRTVGGRPALRHHYALPGRGGEALSSWLVCVDTTVSVDEDEDEDEDTED